MLGSGGTRLADLGGRGREVPDLKNKQKYKCQRACMELKVYFRDLRSEVALFPLFGFHPLSTPSPKKGTLGHTYVPDLSQTWKSANGYSMSSRPDKTMTEG